MSLASQPDGRKRRRRACTKGALANCLGGPNPTLTSQAVATRTAEKIFHRYFDGDPWVKKDSPMSSIDPKVTKAVRKRKL